MSAGLDLLADGSPLRAEVREILAAWSPAELAAVQESATGYPAAIWDAFRRQVGRRLTEPEVVRVALEELGAARCPLPVHAGLIQPLAASLHVGGAGERFREALLGSGDRYALTRPEHLTATREDRRWLVSGRARHLTYGDSAALLLVPARYGASGLVLAVVAGDAPGVRRTTRPSLASDRLTDVEFDGVEVDEPLHTGVPEALAAAELLGMLAVSAELVGMSARLLELTADRVTSRHAFGAPLAALQSVQLRAGDMYLDFVAARDAVAEAAARATPLSVSAAKVTATTSALAIAAGAHQLCGGWGLLDVAGLHHYTRAIKAAESQLGSPRDHRRTIAEHLRA